MTATGTVASTVGVQYVVTQVTPSRNVCVSNFDVGDVLVIDGDFIPGSEVVGLYEFKLSEPLFAPHDRNGCELVSWDSAWFWSPNRPVALTVTWWFGLDDPPYEEWRH